MIAFQISVIDPVSGSCQGAPSSERRRLGLELLPPISCCSLPGRKVGFLRSDGSKVRALAEKKCFGGGRLKTGVVAGARGRKGSLVIVRANPGGFGFNGGGSGGGWDRNTTARVLSNLALAIGLTYLTMTGQLGWFLDAIVSIWLFAVLLPIVGIGAFFWFAGRDIVQDSCPNCGNDFQIFKSSLKDGVQFCPFCTQPFSVQGDKFVREPARFSSNRSTKFGEAFNGFSRQSEKGAGSSATIVDIEAEVNDID